MHAKNLGRRGWGAASSKIVGPSSWTIAVSSLIVQITADMLISDINISLTIICSNVPSKYNVNVNT